MSDELKPCPFCGIPPRAGRRLPPSRGDGYYVGCEQHTKFVPPSDWNRRAVPASVRALEEVAAAARLACEPLGDQSREQYERQKALIAALKRLEECK